MPEQAGLRVLVAAAIENGLLNAIFILLEVDFDTESLQGLVIVARVVDVYAQLVDLAIRTAVGVEDRVADLFELLADVGDERYRVLLPEHEVDETE